VALIAVESKEVIDYRGRLPVRKSSQGYPSRPLGGIDMVVIHYSGVDSDSGAPEIALYQTTKTAGDLFPECAYSFVIRWDGRIEQCHDLEKRTWHAGGRNNDTGIGVCLPGSGWPTSDQLDSAAALIRALNRSLGRGGNRPPLRVMGHKEVSSTLCPGPYWASWKETLMSRVGMGSQVNTGAGSSASKPPPAVVLGFKRVYDYLGAEKCGVPISPERYDGQGNSNQLFTRCEMRWDKATNRVWVSFN
jgi:N-acetyl-anhydromuramyl-L-alanine amidase AmpD